MSASNRSYGRSYIFYSFAFVHAMPCTTFRDGCDASILLNETTSIVNEKTALPNLGSVRGYGVIEDAKAEIEKICPGLVSCADILAVAARDASAAVKTDLSNPFNPLDTLISGFANKGLNTRDMVALSGAHSIGQAQCFLFRDRIYGNGTDIDAGFASTRRRACPQEGENGNLTPLDLVKPNQLDNNYFKNLIDEKVFFNRIKFFLMEDLQTALLLNIVIALELSHLTLLLQ
ncbi:hypothetical protein H5410_056844 [Solanum commersonii]|uniref:peroxidase n=1 Tax=Solanum commersonii TaxID=4109 RepID=A0A9J5WP76_SOLCO|nr:hypothetical protein H5410_056844 [Solanum commersonii]